MAARQRRKQPDDVAELVRTLLITQLALAEVPQRNIRAIVGCDMHHVTAIMKQMDLKGAAKKKGTRGTEQ
jgi:hypothetical protein